MIRFAAASAASPGCGLRGLVARVAEKLLQKLCDAERGGVVFAERWGGAVAGFNRLRRDRGCFGAGGWKRGLSAFVARRRIGGLKLQLGSDLGFARRN